MPTDNNLSSRRMHSQASTERTAFAYEHGAGQRAIDGLDNNCLAFALGAGPVMSAGQDRRVGFSLGGEVSAPAVTAAGQ